MLSDKMFCCRGGGWWTDIERWSLAQQSQTTLLNSKKMTNWILINSNVVIVRQRVYSKDWSPANSEPSERICRLVSMACGPPLQSYYHRTSQSLSKKNTSVSPVVSLLSPDFGPMRARVSGRRPLLLQHLPVPSFPTHFFLPAAPTLDASDGEVGDVRLQWGR